MRNFPNNGFSSRQNPASGVQVDLNHSNIVLLTVTTKKRIPWLTNDVAHQLLHQTWSEATAWLVGDYLLMPDHLHCFCAPQDLRFSIERWISYWKREFALRRKQLMNVPGQLEWKFQPRGWHHRLRNAENYSEKWLYVQENPIRKQLCSRVEDWPFKGKVCDLMWTGR